jgi:hypothetical protein
MHPVNLSVLPNDWSAAQAETVFDFLQQMAEVIWERYEAAILRYSYPLAVPMTKPLQLCLPFPPPEPDDLDDADIPF